VRVIVGLAATAVAHGSNELGMDGLTDRAILVVVGATDLDATAFGKAQGVAKPKPKGFVINEYKSPVVGGTGAPRQVRPEKDKLWGAGQYESPKAKPSLFSQGIKGSGKVYKPPVAKPSLFSQGITSPKYKFGFKPPGQGYVTPKPSQGYSLDNLPRANKAKYWGVGGNGEKKGRGQPAAEAEAKEAVDAAVEAPEAAAASQSKAEAQEWIANWKKVQGA